MKSIAIYGISNIPHLTSILFRMPMISTQQIRQRAIKLSCDSGAGHLAPSLSSVEMLSVLFRKHLTYTVGNPLDETRDRLVFSKGHGAYAYYVILNDLGFLPDEELTNFYTDASNIKGCLCLNPSYMIEASTGSLGHGLPIAVGMAKSFKIQNKPNKVVCIVGDGEMQEGSNFEALTLAYRFKLDNLLIIIDANGIQAMDRVEEVGLDNPRLSKVLSSYSDHFFDLDGHDEVALDKAYEQFFNQKNETFTVMFCNTVKGKGLEMIEDSVKHHYRCPTEDGYVIGDKDV